MFKTARLCRCSQKPTGTCCSQYQQQVSDVSTTHLVNPFNPFAPSYRTLPLPALYQRHERAKRARYEERVLEVERAAFTPLVFSASGGASKLATMFLKRLASVLAEKRKEPYSVTMAWLRTRLSFSLLRSAIACLRSSRRKFWGDDLEIHPVLAAGQAWL